MYEDPKTHRHHLRNVAVRKIRFRPDKDFHEALGKMIFENKTYKDGTSTLPIKSAVNAALKELFEESPIITVNDLRSPSEPFYNLRLQTCSTVRT